MKEITKYVADDGAEFDTSIMCQAHEHMLSIVRKLEASPELFFTHDSASPTEIVKELLKHYTIEPLPF